MGYTKNIMGVQKVIARHPIMGLFNFPSLSQRYETTSSPLVFSVDRKIEFSLSQCLGSAFRSNNPKQVPVFLHTQNLEEL